MKIERTTDKIVKQKPVPTWKVSIDRTVFGHILQLDVKHFQYFPKGHAPGAFEISGGVFSTLNKCVASLSDE